MDPTAAGEAPVDRPVRPRAWLCELMMEDGTKRTQIVDQDPNGLRWNDAGEPSPYRVTPLYGPEAMAAERALWTEAVMGELDGNGQALAIVAYVIGA